MNIATFNPGSVYEMSFIGDSNLRPQFVCVKRTAKTATFKAIDSNETLKRRVKVYDNSEFVLDGNYSMSPRIKASRKVKDLIYMNK